MQRHSRRFQAGFLAAIFAATLQFVLLAGSLSGAFAHSAAESAIAAGGQCSDTPGQHHHSDAACALCPVCLSLTLPGLLPPPAPVPPLPAVRPAQAAETISPQLHLPSRILAAAYPRGPPLI